MNETLTTYETKKILPRVVSLLKLKKGEPITGGEIMTALSHSGLDTTSIRIRAIIHHIRTTHKLRGVASSKNGYWIEKNPVALSRSVKSLANRSLSIRSVATALAEDVVYLQNRAKSCRT